MPARLRGILAFVFLNAVQLRAGGGPDRALTLFDAYLAQSARTVTAYRADIRMGDDPKGRGPERLVGESAYLGRFTYRPKTYAELSRPERALLVHDPQFHAFLLGRAPPPSPGAARPPADGSAADFHCAISPAEMLRSHPVVIELSR